MKLYPKLILFTLAIAIVPLAVVGFRLIRINQEALQTNILERRAELSHGTAALIDDWTGAIEKNISTAVYNRNMKDLSEEKQRPFLEFLLTQYARELTRLALFDSDGRLAVLAVDMNLGEPPDMDAAFFEAAPFESAMKDMRTAFSSPYIGGVEKEARVAMCIPLIGKTGALAVEVKLGRLQDIIAEKRLGRRGEFYLVDSDGRLVAHRDRERAMSREDVSKIPIVKNFLGARTDGSDRFVAPDGERMLGAYGLVKRLDWGVIAQEPESDALFTVMQMRQITLRTAIATIVVAVLAGLLFSRTLVRPVYALVRGTQEYSKGNLEYKIPVQSHDEIGQLVRSFSGMGESLLQRNREIAKINEMAKMLGSLLDRQDLVDAALNNLKSFIECGEIVALLAKGGRLTTEGRVGEDSGANEAGPYKACDISKLTGALERVCAERKGEIVADASSDPHLSSLPLLAGARSLMAAPIVHKDEIKGLLLFKNAPESHPFQREELEFAEIIASSMGLSLENIRLLENMMEKVRMEGELRTAELVQNTLFPKGDPEIPQLDLSGFIRSASETGGDWYGYIMAPESVTVLIGDVTGHGVPAALITAAANSFFKTLEQFRDRLTVRYTEDGGEDPLKPSNILKILNRVIKQTAEGQLVMTFFVSTYFFETRELVFANAGHNHPLIYRKPREAPSETGAAAPAGEGDARAARRLARMASRQVAAAPESGDAAAPAQDRPSEPSAPSDDAAPSSRRRRSGGDNVTILKARGMRLGETADAEYEDKSVVLNPGDIVLWFTDGLIECTNPDGEEYGARRLRALFETLAPHSSREIKEKLVEEAYHFFDGHPTKDDITVIVGKVPDA